MAVAASAVGQTDRLESFGFSFTSGHRLMTQSDQPGIVPGRYWTSAIGASGSLTDLTDGNGRSTGASVTWSAAGASDDYAQPVTGVAATDQLYGGAVFGAGPGREVTVQVSNIPYAHYRIVAYASQDSSAMDTLSVGIGGVRYFLRSDGHTNAGAARLTETTSHDPDAPTSGPAQYQVLAGQSAPSFTLTTGGSRPGVVSANVFGVQVVDEPVGGQLEGPVRILLIVSAIVAAALLFQRAIRRP